MKKQLLVISLLIVSLFSLFGCTKQKSFDLIEFCERYNCAYSDKKINSMDFFIKPVDNGKENSCFLTTSDQKLILLTVSSDSTGTVSGISIVANKENAVNTSAYFSETFDYYIKAISTLISTDFDIALEQTIECGIIKDIIKFEDYSYKTEANGFAYSVFENTEIISLFCEKIKN